MVCATQTPVSSATIHPPSVFGPASPTILGRRASRTARLAAANRVAALDSWWPAVTEAGLVSVLLLSRWPDRAGLLSGYLTVGLLVTLGLIVLWCASRCADPRIMLTHLRTLERGHALATQLACRALTSIDLPLLLQEATTLVGRTLDVEYCAVLESMSDDGTLVLRAGWGWPVASLGLPVMALVDASLTRPTRLSSQSSAPWQRGHPVQSGISIGLHAAQRVYGLLDVSSTTQRIFSDQEIQFLDTVGGIVSAALERSQVDASRQANETALRYRAFHDPLTGLPNRALFADRLHHAIVRVQRDPAPIAVLFVDVNNFKAINDTLGHDAGDDVLIQVADRLSRCLRDGDTAARFGGDEFAVVLEPATESDATRVADRIDEALQSIAMPDGLPPVTASIGIAISSNRAIDGGAMVHLADLAMYRAKSTHRRRAVSLQK